MADEESPLAQALKEDRPIRNVEVIGERHDGIRVHFIPYPTPLHDDSGALIGAVNMLIDVTELKRAEVALRESETRLRQALRAGQVMAFEWDPRTGLSQRSENAAQILGYEPTQVANKVRNNFLARVHPDDRTTFRAHVYGVHTILLIRLSSASFIRTGTWYGWRRQLKASSMLQGTLCASRE
jgi:PAS domain-containing protein